MLMNYFFSSCDNSPPRNMTWSYYQMPTWSTCPTLQVLTFQSSDPVQVTGTVWPRSRTNSTKTFQESMALLRLSTSQPRETSEISPLCTSPRKGTQASPRRPLGSNAAPRQIGVQTWDIADWNHPIDWVIKWMTVQVVGVIYVEFWKSLKISRNLNMP